MGKYYSNFVVLLQIDNHLLWYDCIFRSLILELIVYVFIGASSTFHGWAENYTYTYI